MITKEAIKEAYARIGYKPEDGVFVRGARCCPIGALMLAGPEPDWRPGNTQDDFDPEVKYAAEKLGCNRDVLSSLACGFDNTGYNTGLIHEAYVLGQELRRELLYK